MYVRRGDVEMRGPTLPRQTTSRMVSLCFCSDSAITLCVYVRCVSMCVCVYVTCLCMYVYVCVCVCATALSRANKLVCKWCAIKDHRAAHAARYAVHQPSTRLHAAHSKYEKITRTSSLDCSRSRPTPLCSIFMSSISSLTPPRFSIVVVVVVVGVSKGMCKSIYIFI